MPCMPSYWLQCSTAAAPGASAALCFISPGITSQTIRALGIGSVQVGALPLFSGGIEKAQVRRRLIFPCRHKIAFVVHEVILLADHDVMVVLVAVILEPDDIAIAAIALVDRPGLREGIVDDG